jgi:murein DD-endopeptidase MepM/ murein hydrolase activator NlpD
MCVPPSRCVTQFTRAVAETARLARPGEIYSRVRDPLPIVRTALLLLCTPIHTASAQAASPVRTSSAQSSAPLTVTAAARSIQPGELVVLTISAKGDLDSVRLSAFGTEIPAFRVDAHRWRALVGVDLDVAVKRHVVTISARSMNAPLSTTYELAVRPKHFPTRHLKVDDAFVNPPAALQERIDRESRELAETWTRSAAERLWALPFARPVPAEANSAFGTRSVFNGTRRSPHGGADFPSAAGTPVHAPNAGRVVIARALYFSGNTVVIDHGLGLFSTLAHFSAIEVHEGDVVSRGQVVGLVGATGRVTGPHLHWSVRANGARVDPVSLLAVLGEVRTAHTAGATVRDSGDRRSERSAPTSPAFRGTAAESRSLPARCPSKSSPPTIACRR